MSIIKKSPEDIAGLREAGRIVAETYEVLRPMIKPGVSTGELDQVAEKYIRSKGAIPKYKGYGARYDRKGKMILRPFPATICIAINEVVCHGFPSTHQILQEGDIVGIDIGTLYKGWIGDSCVTFAVGQIDAQSQKLMDVSKRSLELGIEAAGQPNAHIGDIGAAIQPYAESEGFSVVRDMGGHGVGRELWEDPFVPHYGKKGTGPRIEEGMVFTIEPMVNVGGSAITISKQDGWTISTADGSRCAQYEHTMAITDHGVELLTVL